MSKVLMKSMKPTDTNIGIFFRNLRFNRNLLQRELGNLIGLSQGQVSAIEHGKGGITETNYKLICEHFEITDQEKEFLKKYIVGDKPMKRFDPIKNNLGTMVKEIMNRELLFANRISKQISEDQCLIGSIQSHNQPFKKSEIEAFISIVNLSIEEAETLRRLNDYFEWQKKPNREPTAQEKLIVMVIDGAKFKTNEERREYLYDLRNKS